ncbi:MAG: hypothetical protein RML32_05160, partial [Gammaproteobacteria bacterium]|nr:hypothetical protein [Gammaproteobacteria bacterium]
MSVNPPVSRDALRLSTPLFAGNAAYVEALFESFLRDPAALPAPWRDYFAALPGADRPDVLHHELRAQLAERARRTVGPWAAGSAVAAPVSDHAAAKQAAVARLVQIYANRGHLV